MGGLGRSRRNLSQECADKRQEREEKRSSYKQQRENILHFHVYHLLKRGNAPICKAVPPIFYHMPSKWAVFILPKEVKCMATINTSEALKNWRLKNGYNEQGQKVVEPPKTAMSSTSITAKPSTPTPTLDVNTAYNNYTNNQQRAEQLRNQGLDYLKPQDEFTVDFGSLERDPVYQAAMEGARRNTEIAAGDIAAANNRRGIMDSSITRQTSDRVGQDIYADVSRDVLPGLIESYYNRYVDQGNRNRQYAQDLFGMADTYTAEDQRGLDNARTDSQLTGFYMNPETQRLTDQLITLKQQAENPQLSLDERLMIGQQANTIRNQLAQVGADVSLLGADVTSQQARANIPLAFQTQQARQQSQDNQFRQDQFAYQQGRDQRRDYESDRLFDYGVYRDNVGDQQWQQNFEQSVQEKAQQMGYQWATLNQREREFLANQQAQEYEMQLQQMDTDFNRGLELFQSTGQMPSYMEEYGVNVGAMNSDNGEIRAEVEGLYSDLVSGNVTPDQALKMLDDAEKLKIKDSSIINELRKTVHLIAPETDPKVQEQKKKEQKERQETRNEGIKEIVTPGGPWNPMELYKERVNQLKKIFGG